MKKFLFNFFCILLLNIIFNVSSVLANSKITNITLGELNHIILEEGNTNTLEIEYTLTPSDATDKIVWESSNPSVAIVDENGVVTGLTKGKTIITASNQNKDVNATIEIEVFEAKDVKIVQDTGLARYYLFSDGSLFKTDVPTTNAPNGTWIYIENNVKKIAYIDSYLYFIKNDNVLYKYKNNKGQKILDEVLEICGNYLLTMDNKLYEFKNDNIGKVVLENVKSFISYGTTMILTLDNKLYVLDDNVYGEKINNGSKFTTPYLLFENVKEYDIVKKYILINDGALYVYSNLTLNPQIVDTEVTSVENVYNENNVKYFIYTKKENRNISSVSIENKEFKIEKVNNYCIWKYCLKENRNFYHNTELIGKDVTKVIKSLFSVDIYFLTTNGNLYLIRDNKVNLLMFNIDEILENINFIRTNDGEYWYFDFNSTSENKYPEKMIKNTTEKIYPKQLMLYGGSKKNITVGDTLNLLAVVLPYNATNKNLIWKVENEEYGTITKDGMFTAKKAGVVKIIVRTESGSVENFFEITIYPKISGTSHIGPTLVPSQNGSNQKNDLFIDIEPKDALKKDLIFENSNENIIKIGGFYKNRNYYNENGELIKTYDYVVRYYAGSTAGEAYIIIKTEDGEEIDRILIKVYKGINSEIPNYISIDLNEKNTYQLAINKDYDKNMTKFEITGGNGAKIDENGLITVSKPGDFVITIKNIVGSVYETIKTVYLTVNPYTQPIFDKIKGIFNEAKKLIEKIDIGTTIKNLLDSIENNDKVKIVDRNNNEINGNQILKTGYRLYYLDSNSEYRSYTLSISGDVNEDGKISAMDYVKIKNHIMKTNLIVNNENLSAADFNNDGKISAMDYVKIKNYIMNGGK